MAVVLTENDKMIYAFMGGLWQPISEGYSNGSYESWVYKARSEAACQKWCDKHNKDVTDNPRPFPYRKRRAVPLPVNSGIIYGFELPYARDWAWLMKVVETIESVPVFEGRLTDSSYIVSIENNFCAISPDGEAPEVAVTGDTKIEAVYEAVVKFIQWYSKYV